MIMQKKGFLLFLCSLIPGAGELYMGGSVLFHTFGDILYYLLPMHLADSFAMVSGMIKNAVVAVVFLGGGIYLAVNKEKWQDFFEKEN